MTDAYWQHEKELLICQHNLNVDLKNKSKYQSTNKLAFREESAV
jgi:hypothetical protein